MTYVSIPATSIPLMPFQPQPEHGVYTVFVELGDTKIEVGTIWIR